MCTLCLEDEASFFRRAVRTSPPTTLTADLVDRSSSSATFFLLTCVGALVPST